MPPDLDRRTYDILRLVDRHGPIGSIQLVELMQVHGYDIKGRTIRLTLSELDDLGLTTKVPGRGRRLTKQGRRELEQGHVSGRLEQIRARIAQLTSRVTYDPTEDAGVLIVSGAFLAEDDVDDALSVLARLDARSFGPIPVSFAESDENEPGDYRLLVPSSISLDGVLLTHGINATLTNAAVLEYEPADARVDDGDDERGRIVRHVDVINGKGSSIDVITLLIEADRSDVTSILESSETGFLLGDDREFPINRFEEARDLAESTRDSLGGVLDFQRPRERTQLQEGNTGWSFGSITYAGTGELLLTALYEYDLTTSWETLYGMVSRHKLESVQSIARLPEPTDS
ncbi:NrpR regulatory domain-containing protein [Natrarchaeobius sp. A-rgal3]|uniref:NrpR regulatory domain-containing protein n=1 Tax=Natrarchaeobius versutus TaxID=1679078 RepID=UPI00350EA8A9